MFLSTGQDGSGKPNPAEDQEINYFPAGSSITWLSKTGNQQHEESSLFVLGLRKSPFATNFQPPHLRSKITEPSFFYLSCSIMEGYLKTSYLGRAHLIPPVTKLPTEYPRQFSQNVKSLREIVVLPNKANQNLTTFLLFQQEKFFSYTFLPIVRKHLPIQSGGFSLLRSSRQHCVGGKPNGEHTAAAAPYVTHGAKAQGKRGRRERAQGHRADVQIKSTGKPDTMKTLSPCGLSLALSTKLKAYCLLYKILLEE